VESLWDNDQIANRDLKLKFIFIRKVKGRRGKCKVQRSDFRDSAKVKRLRQIGAEMV